MPDKLFAFQYKMIRFADEGRAVDVISLDFSKAFTSIYDDILYPSWDAMV